MVCYVFFLVIILFQVSVLFSNRIVRLIKVVIVVLIFSVVLYIYRVINLMNIDNMIYLLWFIGFIFFSFMRVSVCIFGVFLVLVDKSGIVVME